MDATDALSSQVSTAVSLRAALLASVPARVVWVQRARAALVASVLAAVVSLQLAPLALVESTQAQAG